MVNPFDNATNITLNDKTVVRITTRDGGVIYGKPQLGGIPRTILVQFGGDENDPSTRRPMLFARFVLNGENYENVSLTPSNNWTATIYVPIEYENTPYEWIVPPMKGYGVSQYIDGETTIFTYLYNGSSPK